MILSQVGNRCRNSWTWIVCHVRLRCGCHILYQLHFKSYYNHTSKTSDTSDINSDTYIFTSTYILWLNPYPIITCPVLTAFLSLPSFISVFLNSHSSPYLFFCSTCYLSQSPLALSYCITNSLHFSVLHYINHSYFVVVLQFVNCCQLLAIQVPLSVYCVVINFS